MLFHLQRQKKLKEKEKKNNFPAYLDMLPQGYV